MCLLIQFLFREPVRAALYRVFTAWYHAAITFVVLLIYICFYAWIGFIVFGGKDSNKLSRVSQYQ
jgi:hypothetical protein